MREGRELEGGSWREGAGGREQEGRTLMEGPGGMKGVSSELGWGEGMRGRMEGTGGKSGSCRDEA